MTDQLQIPDADKWFPSVFGNDAGEKLAATYRSTWETVEDSLIGNVSGLFSNGKTHISVKEISNPPKPAADAATEFTKSASAIFYAVTAAKDKEPGSPLPGVYVYVQGAFYFKRLRFFCVVPAVAVAVIIGLRYRATAPRTDAGVWHTYLLLLFAFGITFLLTAFLGSILVK